MAQERRRYSWRYGLDTCAFVPSSCTLALRTFAEPVIATSHGGEQQCDVAITGSANVRSASVTRGRDAVHFFRRLRWRQRPKWSQFCGAGEYESGGLGRVAK